MKLIAIAAAAAVLMLGTAAQAQQAQQKSPLYGEVGYTFMKIDDGQGGNSRPGAIRLIGGYDFHPNFALEGLAAWGVNDDEQTISGVRVKSEVDSVYGLYAKGKYNYQNWEFFGRAGFAHTKVKATGTLGAVSVSASDSDTDFSYGVGVNYQFNPKWYAGIDYMVYNDSDDARVRGFTLSVGYRF